MAIKTTAMKFPRGVELIAVLTVLGPALWVGWWYVHLPVTFFWNHPAQPTAYLNWRQRPAVVRDGLGKAVQLRSGSVTVFTLKFPHHARHVQLEATANDAAHIRVNGEPLLLAEKDQWQTPVLPIHGWLPGQVLRFTLALDPGSSPVTIHRLILRLLP